MAKVNYISPVESVSGRIDKNSDTYLTTRWGQKIQSHYPLHKDPSKITDKQRAQQDSFKQADAEMKRQLADPVLAAQWRERFEYQKSHPSPDRKPYKIFRNFVLAQLALNNNN